jgi:kynureninase
VAPENVAASITPEVAVVMITEMDYRTVRRHVWDDVDFKDLYAKSMALCQLLITLIEKKNSRHGLTLFGSRDMENHGSHVSFHCLEGYAVMQALIAHGNDRDFRMPDVIRFGITLLHTGYAEIWDAATILTRILDEKLWNKPEFLAKKAVTR